MTTTLEEAKTKALALQSAINNAIPSLLAELTAIKTVEVRVDDRSGFKQTGHIDANNVRSIVFNICAEAAQALPESVQCYMPDKGKPYVSGDDLKTLISHLNMIARAL